MFRNFRFGQVFICLGFIAWASICNAGDCDKFLIPDFEFSPRDVATDLSYLAVISSANFASHRKNADPLIKNPALFEANVHLGLDLPIASALLLSSANYADFAAKREQKFQAYHFNYSVTDLSAYYARLLPAQRLANYEKCADADGLADGLHVRIEKVDRDLIKLAITWNAAAAAPSEAALTKVVVSGGALQGAMPTKLKSAQESIFVFTRDLDKDFRLAGNANGDPVSVSAPRFITSEPAIAAADAQCASAANVVHAVYRRILARDIEPAQLPHQVSLLQNNVNSVRQLVEVLLNSPEYARKFADGKANNDLLRGLYQRILVREPDPAGLAYNTRLIATLGSSGIALSFVQGHEYQQRFGEWGVPGAAPPMKYCGKK